MSTFMIFVLDLECKIFLQRKCLFYLTYRQNRKWMYDSIEIEGTDEAIRNKFRWWTEVHCYTSYTAKIKKNQYFYK
jgi:hypothetical protein